MKWTPLPYHLKAVQFVIERACAGLFLDPGLGKTSIMLQSFNLLKQKKMVRRMLVIAPLRVCYSTWPAEAAKWDELKSLKVGILHGPNKETVLRDPTVTVHVINPEGLPWLFSTVRDVAMYWDMLTVDESTKFKAHGTKRFELIRPVLQKFRRRYILTGSPAPNGLEDLWGQVFILDLGNSLGPYITHYRTTYFTKDYTGFNWVPQRGSDERIYKRLGPLVLRMEGADYLELPPLIGACGFKSPSPPSVRWVDLPDEAQIKYREMEEDLITRVKENKVVASNAAAATGKCRQIANGGLYGMDPNAPEPKPGELVEVAKRLTYHLHDEKTEATADLIEEASGVPCLVAYEFGHDLERLSKKFPKAPYIGGGVSPKTFKAIERDWNAGRLKVLLAQPQSVAHGLNLQATRARVIFHSLTWDREVYEQFIQRVWRNGQRERVFVDHILAKGTVDEMILKMLTRKDKVQTSLLDALKEYTNGLDADVRSDRSRTAGV